MPGNLRHFFCRICLLLTLALPLQAVADDFSSDALNELSQQLDIAETTFMQPGSKDIYKLDSLNVTAAGLEQRAQDCISTYSQKQAQTQQAIDSLGEPAPEEDAEVKSKRKELGEQKQQVEKNLSQCRLLGLRATTLLEETRASRQTILKQQLFAPSESSLDHLYTLLFVPGVWKTEASSLWQNLSSPPLNWKNLWIALAYGTAGLLVGLFWSIQKSRQYREQLPVIHSTSPTLAAVWLSLLRVMPLALFAGLAALSLHFAPPGLPTVQQFMLVLLIFSLSYSILRSLLRKTMQVDGIVPVDPQAGHKLYLWARLLMLATLLGVIFHSPLLDNASPENPAASSLTGLIRLTLGSLIGFALARLVWLMAGHFLFLRRSRLHLLTASTLVVAVASLWLGYRNFAIFLFTGVFGSLFLLLAGWLLLKIPTEIFDGLDTGHTPWQQRWRAQLGLKSGQPAPGLIWIRLSITLVVSGLLLILGLRLWGMPEQNFSLLLAKLASGFQIGGFTLEPLRIISGLLVLALLVSLTHVFKKNLAEHWLSRTSLSKGAREAITTVSGYSGILLAILLGLSIAGIEFQNLAIIAGALSVGIGFGLQNIVNNFVSGLILLLERPIRKGDWIKVGNAEGYVREISIRSTTIQTFDRSDIIVPNSEIISGQVTNMMLNDNFSRIILPVSVAHGSDTERVMEILRQAANNHPNVLKNHNDMKITVLFRGFGENALNFELRCFIREVESRAIVISDLNLAIDKAFRQPGVEIPLPQRTVHLVAEEVAHSAKTVQSPAKPADLG